jgi:hypothetical protein
MNKSVTRSVTALFLPNKSVNVPTTIPNEKGFLPFSGQKALAVNARSSHTAMIPMKAFIAGRAATRRRLASSATPLLLMVQLETNRSGGRGIARATRKYK